MIFTPLGMSVKHVAALDEESNAVTVIGFHGEIFAYDLDSIHASGIEEIRADHENYLALRDAGKAPTLPDVVPRGMTGDRRR